MNYEQFINIIKIKTDISKIYTDQKVDYFILLTGKEIYKGTERNFSVSFLDTNYPFIYFMPGQMEGYCIYKDCTSYLKEGKKEYTIDEIKELLISRKWYYTIFEGIKALYVTTSHEIAGRIAELAERYEDTLPSLESDVASYEAKVKTHLERMGFVW